MVGERWGEDGARLLVLDQLPEPLLPLGEMDQIGGARTFRVAVAERLVDVPVPPFRRLDRVLLRDRAPEPCPERAAGEVLDQGGERRVARGVDDDPVELLVGRDERLGRLGGVHPGEAVLERGEVVLGQPAAAMPVATGSRIRRTWWSSSSVGPVSRSLMKPMPVSSSSGSRLVT